MKKDDIKTIIVVVVVCVVCLTIGLVLNLKSNFDKLSPVSEYGVFFSEVKYINNYLNYISNNDKEGVFNLLNVKYIEENNINYDNVLEYVDNYSGSCSVKVTDMNYVKLKSNITLYYVKGKVYKNDFEGEILVDDNFSVVLINDFDNLSFSIYPVSDNYKKIINNMKNVKIAVNDYNKITNTELISKEQMCVIYFSDFINKLLFDYEKSYNLLSNNMKNNYTTVDSYVNYVNNNGDLFSTTADKCKLEQNDDKRVYTVIDSNENTYVFTEEYIMNYKVDFYLKEVNE